MGCETLPSLNLKGTIPRDEELTNCSIVVGKTMVQLVLQIRAILLHSNS